MKVGWCYIAPSEIKLRFKFCVKYRNSLNSIRNNVLHIADNIVDYYKSDTDLNINMNFTPELLAFQGAISSADNAISFSKITARGGIVCLYLITYVYLE